MDQDSLIRKYIRKLDDAAIADRPRLRHYTAKFTALLTDKSPEPSSELLTKPSSELLTKPSPELLTDTSSAPPAGEPDAVVKAPPVTTVVSKAATKSITYYINKIVAIQESLEPQDAKLKRYALFPILDEKSYEFYLRQENIHWSESELDFTADRQWYDSATPVVKRIMDNILGFFLLGDGVISKNIIMRFLMEASTYEEQCMFISQLHIELIHAATYGLAAFTFKRDPQAMAELISTIETTDCIQGKIAFMERWSLADRPLYERYVAFAAAEGIFFCAVFAVIFWFRSKGMFPNFITANELIARDESLHRDYGAHLFAQERARLLAEASDTSPLAAEIQQQVLAILAEAVECADRFAAYILVEPLEDLNTADLQTYIRLIADNLLQQLGYPVHYHARNPFSWLNDIAMEQKGNFYEVRVAAYQKKSLSDLLDWRKRAGLTEASVNAYANPEEVDF